MQYEVEQDGFKHVKKKFR